MGFPALVFRRGVSHTPDKRPDRGERSSDGRVPVGRMRVRLYIGGFFGGLKGRRTIAQGNALGSDGVKKIPHPANHPPTCPQQVGGWFAGCGGRGVHRIPRVPLRRWRRSTLGWVDLPLRGAPSIPIYSWEHSPLPSTTRGFAPGYRPPGLQPGLMVSGGGLKGRWTNV